MPPDVNFDNANVLPLTPFLDTDGPLEFFSELFPDDLIDLLVKQSNLYVEQNKPKHWADVTNDEVKAFLGILIGMRVHKLPAMKLYWSTDPFFRVQPIADVMSRNRFMKIQNNLHVTDNSNAVSRGNLDMTSYSRLSQC